MSPRSANFFESVSASWADGGWLMLPLFALAVFIYYTAIDLYLRLSGHFLIRGKVYQFSEGKLLAELKHAVSPIRPLILTNCGSIRQIRRRFVEVRNEYLPVINRRIRFLAIIITTGPLLGLLGTVSGMLSTFNGMAAGQGSKFENVVQGISEALITTQVGLILSIPALVVLSLIVHHRNRLERCIARLEYFNIKLAQPKHNAG